MLDAAPSIAIQLNGESFAFRGDSATRLSNAIREHAGLTGTKSGCDAGDCGACTVLVDGAPVCACLMPVAQAEGAAIITIEGIQGLDPEAKRLQRAFHRHGAAQCGICTPGMLMAAIALLRAHAAPTESQVQDAIGGVLCRCTGYRKIIAAIMDTARDTAALEAPPEAPAVGQRVARLDGVRKIDGSEKFGADERPQDALLLRAIRAPFHRARFRFGDLEEYQQSHPGLARIFTAADVPGENCFGVIPPLADQPVFAVAETRFRGEAVAAIVGDPAAVAALDLTQFPVTWEELPAVLDVDAALATDAPRLHANRPGNILVRGRVVCGDADTAMACAAVTASGQFETGFVEHAYIEPEAGYARRVGDRIEISACTQSPFMDRDDVAKILGLAPEAVRIMPTAVGGGFGSKLDLSVQPFIAIAAWHLNRPVQMIYSRPESMATTTKRHPARINATIGADQEGRVVAMTFSADFNTGAYASWGPTVANRVPIHASGPYAIANYRAETRAVHTHCVPAGAFRGFGVPQASIAQEQLFDELAGKLGMDRLEFRIRNALSAETPTVTGQVLGAGVGIKAALESLRPHWQKALTDAAEFNRSHAGSMRRGVGVAGMWYGCGNTSMSNPSTMRAGVRANGEIILHQGAVDIGQGSNTAIPQIFADALGVPLRAITLDNADTDRTPDCGKTSASRQTFVTGRAAEMAGRNLRAQILRLANAGDGARITPAAGRMTVAESGREQVVALDALPRNVFGYALMAEETFDPPTTPLDENGQGSPYAVYGFGAHLAEVEVDIELGTTRVLKIVAAHDVGRAINPTLIEGQIEGGIAQGLGLALMEEFVPGRGENLHDYLIPTVGDMPPVESILIEDASPLGPFGAKGIGEQALIPTAPAILNAIHHATGVRMRRIPATPSRLRAAILQSEIN
ncbi:MAG: molybdopterin-dependent oxidoreductase [Beijerinckiaceae bacterium]